MGTLKPQSNGPLYSNTVIVTLAADGWAVTFGTAKSGLGELRPRPVPSSNVTAQEVVQLSTAEAFNSDIIMLRHLTTELGGILLRGHCSVGSCNPNARSEEHSS